MRPSSPPPPPDAMQYNASSANRISFSLSLQRISPGPELRATAGGRDPSQVSLSLPSTLAPSVFCPGLRSDLIVAGSDQWRGRRL